MREARRPTGFTTSMNKPKRRTAIAGLAAGLAFILYGLGAPAGLADTTTPAKPTAAKPTAKSPATSKPAAAKPATAKSAAVPTVVATVGARKIDSVDIQRAAASLASVA